MSDTHFDPHYHEGSVANCNEPLCCRLTDGLADVPANGAGRWGDYRKCDTPRHTIESMLQHIANYHQVLKFFFLKNRNNELHPELNFFFKAGSVTAQQLNLIKKLNNEFYSELNFFNLIATI